MTSAATVILPTFNEADSIVSIVERIFSAKPPDHDYSVIVVDDGSTDGTEETVRGLASRFPVTLIQRGKRLGLASAVREGARAAATDWIVVMDADGSHPPEMIPALLALNFREEIDLVIGSRHAEGGRISGWPLKRRLLSRHGTLLSSLLTRVYDPLSGFFSCRRDALLRHGGKAEGYKILLEVLANAPPDVRVREVPIHFQERVNGASKMSLRVQLQFFAQLGRLFRERVAARPFSALLIHLSLMLFADLSIAALLHFGGAFTTGTSYLFGCGLFFLLWVGYFSVSPERLKFFSRFKSYSVLFLTTLTVYSLGSRVAIVEHASRAGLPDSPGVFLGAILAADLLFFAGLILGHLLSAAAPDRANPGVRHALQSLTLIGAILLFKLLYLGLPDLIPQEALHWNRAMRLAPAYVDHPGGVAVLVKAATTAFGKSEFAVRFGAFLSGVIAALFIYGIGLHLTGRRSTGFVSAAVFSLCPFFWGTGFFMFPDSPLVVCWAGAIYFLLRGVKGSGSIYWLLGGVCVGLTAMSKYTVIALFFSLALYFLFTGHGRKLLVTRRPWLLALAALATMSPLLIFEMSRGWVTFRFQFLGRVASHGWGFPSYLGSLMGEITPVFLLLVLLVAVILARRWRALSHGPRFLLLSSIPLLVLYGVYSQWNHVKFSWPAPAFISLIPLVVGWIQDHPERYGRLKVASIFTLTLFHLVAVLVFAFLCSIDLSVLPSKAVREAVVWKGVGSGLRSIQELHRGPDGRAPFVIGLDKYSVASEVSYYADLDLGEVTSRNAVGRDGLTWNAWSDLPSYAGRRAILLSQRARDLSDPRLDAFFSSMSPVQSLTVASGLQTRALHYRVGMNYQGPIQGPVESKPD